MYIQEDEEDVVSFILYSEDLSDVTIDDFWFFRLLYGAESGGAPTSLTDTYVVHTTDYQTQNDSSLMRVIERKFDGKLFGCEVWDTYGNYSVLSGVDELDRFFFRHIEALPENIL